MRLVRDRPISRREEMGSFEIIPEKSEELLNGLSRKSTEAPCRRLDMALTALIRSAASNF